MKPILIMLAAAAIFCGCRLSDPPNNAYPEPEPAKVMTLSFTKPGGVKTTFSLRTTDSGMLIADSADQLFMKQDKQGGTTIWQGTEKLDSFNYTAYSNPFASYSIYNINYDHTKCPLPSLSYVPEHVTGTSFTEVTQDSAGISHPEMNQYTFTRDKRSITDNVVFASSLDTEQWYYTTDTTVAGVKSSSLYNGILVWLILCYEQAGFSSLSDLSTSVSFTNGGTTKFAILLKNGVINSSVSPNSYMYSYVPGINGAPMQQMTMAANSGESFTISFAYTYGYD